MKFSTIVIGCIFVFTACQNKQQNVANNLRDKIQNTLETNSPGFVSTTKNGYWMSAKLAGNEWTASAMMPIDNSNSKRIQGEHNGESIGFYLDMRGLGVGKHIDLSDNHAADLITNDDIGIWAGKNGKITITKMDDSAMEGTFSFTASSSQTNKTLLLTNGHFRIPLGKK